MTVSDSKEQGNSHTVTMSVHLIRYMNKLYLHIYNITSDTTMLLVSIYKPTQVTNTCTNMQNDTYEKF